MICANTVESGNQISSVETSQADCSRDVPLPPDAPMATRSPRLKMPVVASSTAAARFPSRMLALACARETSAWPRPRMVLFISVSKTS